MPTFTSPQNVTVACATSGATIRYTEGASPADPTEASPEVTGPIYVADTKTIKARGFKPGLTPSAVATYPVVIARLVYYGYSTNTILDAAGVAALSNAPGTNQRASTTITGTYVFGAGATADDYFFVWIDDALNDPVADTGFRLTSNGFIIAMASSGDGFTSTVNGWSYLPLTKDGRTGKLFRSAVKPGAGTSWTITGD